MSTTPEIIIGIDLGTTNSLVAICDQRGPRILPDAQGRAMLPSVVRYEEGAHARGGLRTIVGAQARDNASSFPASTVHSVKRLMGRSLADATPDLPYLHYAVAAGDHDTARIKLPFAAALISPQEVSAAILAALKAQAQAALGHPVAKAVITVPAYFDDAQRQATRDAGRLAGLDVVRIVNEPTAAALAYGLGVQHTARHTEPRTVAVYDLGGGTFDISILRITPATTPDGTAFFQVLATAGDTHLGGDDIDQALVALFAKDLAARGTPPPDAAFKALLRREAERIKIVLSDRDAAEASLPLPGGASFKRAVTRQELETLIEPLLQRTLAACKRAVTDAKLTAPVDAAVLVGGATRTPIVRARVGEFFGVTPYTAIDPDQAVALGAAVQASILSGSHKGSLLLDVIPLSLGIETAGGAVAKILTRNTTIPARAREIFSTEVDGQTSIKIHVLQGEREMAEHCRSLGLFHLRGIPPMPAGIPQLEVEFLADASGVLHVSAHERRSGRRAQLQVVPSHGLSRDEVDRIERESFTHAREDMARHRVVDLVVNSRLDLKWIGERLERFGPRLDPAVLAGLTALAAELRGLVDRAAADWHSVDPDLFYRTKESLDRQSIPLQELSIAESLRASQPPQTPPPPRM